MSHLLEQRDIPLALQYGNELERRIKRSRTNFGLEGDHILSIADVSNGGSCRPHGLIYEVIACPEGRCRLFLAGPHGYTPYRGKMAARKLGGGRILGSGKNLSPASAALPPRTTSIQSPSASSISVNSSVSTSTDPQDLHSRISFDQADENGPTSTSTASVLFCPICNDEMVTLLQLNRHLDDNHKNLEEFKQDEVKDWFKTQMIKAKRFQPLAVLNQKFKGLEVFESNDPPRSPNLVPNGTPQERTPPDPDEVIKRDHWQRHGPYDRCSDPGCGRRLGSTTGNVNCRKCGKLFCDEHTMYQMKLSRSAQHEPVRGLWCRVCETCYRSREGYNDRTGAMLLTCIAQEKC